MDVFLTQCAQLAQDIVSMWERYGSQYLGGMRATLIMAVLGTLFGCLIGFVCGILSTIPCGPQDHVVKRFFLKLIRALIRVYVEVFRGTPMILQAVFIYYGLPYFSGNAFHWNSIFMAALVVVSINTGAYMAESVRGGFLSIDPGQTEGAKAIGMNHVQTMLHVIIPQAFRVLLPQIGNNLIINIKDTCVLSVIGTVELFYTTKGIAGTYYTFFEAFTITLVLYFILTFACSRILRLVEDRMDGPVNYELVMQDQLVATTGTYRFNEKKQRKYTDQNLDTREGGR